MPIPVEPSRPVAAVLAVVPRGDGVLLVRRANPPDAGLWGFPGGKVEFGEALPDAAVRELREETAVTAEPVRVLTALDAFEWRGAPTPHRHFILVAVLCRWLEGEPVAGDDALEARWFSLADLTDDSPDLSRDVAAVARLAAAAVPPP
ncbi:NUDIX hydrolase [Azospirillum halopraeferens]|uniref:NUDIX hydrolase n=1 Tax=Azospirillum halopraeferens TaxID=34010 RepID=UPI000414A3FB|nr:NUDIX hydrolase [Azospirillum halopraeferens]